MLWRCLRVSHVVWALTVLAVPAFAQAPSFTAGDVGAPRSNARGELFQPAGKGPFPAMVVLHGCDGIGPHYREWGRRLADWGYMTLLVDSFRPRGFTQVCNHGTSVPAEVQASDGFAAAAFLRSLPSVQGDHIGVIGFSHGGWAVLKAVLAGAVEEGGGIPFTAGVAFYPGCDPPATKLATDTLLLIGDADDWTPVRRCERWRDAVRTDGHVMQMQVYPGAVHGFDSGRPEHWYAGHQVGGNGDAGAAAIELTRVFLAQRLRPRQ